MIISKKSRHLLVTLTMGLQHFPLSFVGVPVNENVFSSQLGEQENAQHHEKLRKAVLMSMLRFRNRAAAFDSAAKAGYEVHDNAVDIDAKVGVGVGEVYMYTLIYSFGVDDLGRRWDGCWSGSRSKHGTR